MGVGPRAAPSPSPSRLDPLARTVVQEPPFMRTFGLYWPMLRFIGVRAVGSQQVVPVELSTVSLLQRPVFLGSPVEDRNSVYNDIAEGIVGPARDMACRL